MSSCFSCPCVNPEVDLDAPLPFTSLSEPEYEKMVEDIPKIECDEDIILLKKRRKDRLKEEKLVQAIPIWMNEIIPNWYQMKNAVKTRTLWWNGLPSCVRGTVWSLTIGNQLKITGEKYKECVEKSKEILKCGYYEYCLQLIRLDIDRTFPQLRIFQRGGPYYDVLVRLLGAYVCYRPEMRYVQGMTFIAAVLLLNMEELDAFICFANMLDMPCLKAFYSLDNRKMEKYYRTYSNLLGVNMYDLYAYFSKIAFSPDLYLSRWIRALFSNSVNLDLACRIWDVIIRDGENFIFRAALGIMHLNRSKLLKMDSFRATQYLTNLPDDISPSQLFKSISFIIMRNESFSFDNILQYYEDL